MTSFTGSRGRFSAALLLTAVACLVAKLPTAHAANNLTLWDTAKSASAGVDTAVRSDWKPVPKNLMALEADPAKSASDPGYYGRAFVFEGDAVMENRYLAVRVSFTEGRAMVFANSAATRTATNPTPGAGTWQKVAELAPTGEASRPGRIETCRLVRNSGDDLVLDVVYSAPNAPEQSVRLSLGRDNILQVQPSATLKGFTVAASLDYGVVPDFIADDLVLGADSYPEADSLTAPVENLFVGLLTGGNSMFALAWPNEKQLLKLRLGKGADGKRVIAATELASDAKGFCLAAWATPGVWHREALKPSFLEKAVPISWQRPFPARWKTQLLETDVLATFVVREGKAQIWRGVPGSYFYPVWFEDDRTVLQLGKKIPPRGDAVFYFLEASDTPEGILAPVDVLKAAVGRLAADTMLDPAGRMLRTHHRRGGTGVRRACTCGCTEYIQAIFEAGEEVQRQAEIREALDDMKFFVQRHLERIGEYRQFATDMVQRLEKAKAAGAERGNYAASLLSIPQQILQEFSVQQENMKSLSHADELIKQTQALANRKDAKNLAAYMELLKAWRDMGGAQDYVVAQCHTLTRKLAQEAGYRSVNEPKLLELAREIRALCRRCLRNPDGYEVWADY